MKLLFAAAEGSPFIKTGGLADVIAALPKALHQLGDEVRVILPKYKVISADWQNRLHFMGHFEVPVGWRVVYCGVFQAQVDGVTYYLLDNEYYFGARDGIYGHFDDGERFSFFNRAVLEALRHLQFYPDIIHSHDWHAGMIGALLHKHYSHNSLYPSIRTVFTIHNLQYQGVFPYEVMTDMLGLDAEYFHPERLEFKGGVSFMKAGIVYSDRVTTVSRTYADEIRTEHYGEGLDGTLRWLGPRLIGVVNGIDETSYNPASDAHLIHRYRSSFAKKQANKLELQRRLGLKARRAIPMIGMVTRLTAQKGLDLVTHVLQELLENDELQLVVLGSGDAHYEQQLFELARRYSHKLAVQIRFDEGLARQIYAASDMFLMPSKFEPCGLSQLIALRYGSIPIVRETGGLNDTVFAYNEYNGEGNGFSFTHYNAHDMLFSIRRALSFYRQPEHWKRLFNHAIEGDYSWNESARQYRHIYEELLQQQQPEPIQ